MEGSASSPQTFSLWKRRALFPPQNLLHLYNSTTLTIFTEVHKGLQIAPLFVAKTQMTSAYFEILAGIEAALEAARRVDVRPLVKSAVIALPFAVRDR
jgi:hypothetical protein